MRLLLVEDEPTLNQQVATGLRAEGYLVEAVGNGQDALHLGLEEDFTAAVLDLGLPGMDGLSVLKHWRRRGRNLPVLAGEAYYWYNAYQNPGVAAAYAVIILGISVVATLLYLRLMRSKQEGAA